jgi:tryptophan synthase alpha chain
VFLQQLGSYGLSNPVLVGFGIKDKESFDRAAAHANGAIIGTAFIRALHGQTNLREATCSFLQTVIG